ncbi:prepilin-type N-terminal cleavage/methylation domain-containing protein [Solirubrobacter sp. CPCC 204708]|uniref:Prepilin-type N-terminal cleavage/methylation domain-containing protein n=1 Tax=Solirubrobacter deserti TaxID=2282478 RepID=A0ABT4RPR1_9ACTN|nr:prepilin-type N-terminal cleavage/methylation domain-containing protein [Solirubrobacter deserti]MBE2316608.1 prepilin-type N-terminal cleavage/methylation domain-containing protein [Solirubrobacter deserti]MDA0140506.1 prepilin-type N-terminal cleavage/methylation domain-containing protein [Solirubrobacter deserti]
MRRLRTEERGFTLIEVLTAMTIGLIVSFAVFSLVEVVMRRSADISTRVDTTQRARTAMDQITRQLRSQVCTQRAGAAEGRTIDAASPTSISVYADFSDETLNTSGQLPAPDLRKIAFDPVTRALTETVTKGTRDSVGYVVYGTAGTTRRILGNVAATYFADAPANTLPVVFRYFRYPNTTATLKEPTEEIAPLQNRALTADELNDVARIEISYRALNNRGQRAGSTVLENSVYVRTFTPNNPDQVNPQCKAY